MDRTLIFLCTLLGIVVVAGMALVAGGGLTLTGASELEAGFLPLMGIAIGYRLVTASQQNRPIHTYIRRWRCGVPSCNELLPCPIHFDDEGPAPDPGKYNWRDHVFDHGGATD